MILRVDDVQLAHNTEREQVLAMDQTENTCTFTATRCATCNMEGSSKRHTFLTLRRGTAAAAKEDTVQVLDEERTLHIAHAPS